MPEHSPVPRETSDGYEVQGDDLRVLGAGLVFNVEYDGSGVDVEVEFPDYGAWSGPRTTERYATIPWAAWDAIVAHIERLRRA